jgi:hypothetical protein
MKRPVSAVNFTLYVLITIVLLSAEYKLRRMGMKKAGKITTDKSVLL